MTRKGRKAEDKAVKYLGSHGHHVITRNFFCYRGEIDVITFDEDYVVFVEVKQRGSGSFVSPEESITAKKKQRLIKCAKRWLMENEYRGDTRFDVIAISEGELTHYEDAIKLRSC
ncbi:MAG: YraN family protein [Candidatus Bipolaricaulia bacterium]